MNSTTIKGLEVFFEIELEDDKTSKLLYEALKLESKSNPNERANATLEVYNNILRLKIDAKDSISARAAINSFLKWINLSIQLIDQIRDE